MIQCTRENSNNTKKKQKIEKKYQRKCFSVEKKALNVLYIKHRNDKSENCILLSLNRNKICKVLNKKRKKKEIYVYTLRIWIFVCLSFACLHFVVRSFFFFLSWKRNAARLIYGFLFYFCLTFNSLHEIGEFFLLFTGILIMNQSQQRIHQIASDLHINAVQKNDSGRYTCAKINNNKQTQQVEILKNIKLEIICKYIICLDLCTTTEEVMYLYYKWND